MNIRKRILTVTAGVLLTLFTADAHTLFTHASRGTIVSIGARGLALTHLKNGKSETLVFVLTPATVRQGILAAGTVVAVHYRIEHNQKFVTSIQAQPENPD